MAFGGVRFGIGVYNYEELLVDRAHGDPSVVVVRVRFRDEERVFEYGKGDFESDAVLGEVASGFGSVPFELIDHRLAAGFTVAVRFPCCGPSPAEARTQ